jgi:hypothetical protein
VNRLELLYSRCDLLSRGQHRGSAAASPSGSRWNFTPPFGGGSWVTGRATKRPNAHPRHPEGTDHGSGLLFVDVDEADSDRVADQADSITYGELLEDVVQMRFHGHFADEQLLRDLGVVKTQRDETRDFALTGGTGFWPRVLSTAWRARLAGQAAARSGRRPLPVSLP